MLERALIILVILVVPLHRPRATLEKLLLIFSRYPRAMLQSRLNLLLEILLRHRLQH